jgi:DMSO/TMAO reductase YedYZ molybdopterin-dependent catalytic subunit
LLAKAPPRLQPFRLVDENAVPAASTEHASSEHDGSRPIGRRVFLATVLGGLTSLYWGKAVWGRVSHELGGVESAIPLIPSKGWRIYTVAATMPTFDAATWRLKISGLVEQPLELSYDDLQALPQASQVSVFHCVTGWTVNGVHWRGVRFKDLLAKVRPLPDAHALQFVSAEQPYIDYLTLAQATLPDVMLAWEMDGEPLLREHGAPVRVVIPDMYGYKNVKWVAEINLIPKAEYGYWEVRGYDRDAWVGRSNGYTT